MQDNLWQLTINSPLGSMQAKFTDKGLKSLFFVDIAGDISCNSDKYGIREQIDAYFKNPHTLFEVPLDMCLTEFSSSVLNACKAVKVGSVISYKSLAISLSLHNHARAVAMALSRNNIAIIIPCHRIVHSSDRINLVSYRWGLHRKIALLEHEKVLFR